MAVDVIEDSLRAAAVRSEVVAWLAEHWDPNMSAAEWRETSTWWCM